MKYLVSKAKSFRPKPPKKEEKSNTTKSSTNDTTVDKDTEKPATDDSAKKEAPAGDGATKEEAPAGEGATEEVPVADGATEEVPVADGASDGDEKGIHSLFPHEPSQRIELVLCIHGCRLLFHRTE